jgi:hypothetical protein
MLKSIDVLIGLSVVMLMVSLVVTVITQAVTNLMQTRGKNLRDGIGGLLQQIHGDLPKEISEKISEAILTHPLIKSAGSKFGTVIHREELTGLLLELATDEGPQKLEQAAKDELIKMLNANGIADPAKTIDNVRSLVLKLEAAHPELANNERYAIAYLQEASTKFLSKIHGWFDQTMDRVSDRFTSHARIITFFGSLAVALFLQLDTVTLVSRLETDPVLRQNLVQAAVNKVNQGPPTNGSTSSTAQQGTGGPTNGGATGTTAPPIPKEQMDDLNKLAAYDIIDMPTSGQDWIGRLRNGTVMKLLGILLTAMLLSLGAPFWYNALKNLIKLRSVIAQKDDDQRAGRQTGDKPGDGGGTTTPTLVVGERGDLSSVG